MQIYFFDLLWYTELIKSNCERLNMIMLIELNREIVEQLSKTELGVIQLINNHEDSIPIYTFPPCCVSLHKTRQRRFYIIKISDSTTAK